MTFEYTSIKSVITEYLKMNISQGEIDRTFLLSAANDGIEKISTGSIFENRVKVLPVQNYYASLPTGFKSAIQVLYRKKPAEPCRREDVVEWTQQCFGSGCKLIITKECPTCHMEGPCDCSSAAVIVQADNNWRNAHPGLQVEGHKQYKGEVSTDGRACNKTISEFQILPYSTNNFHLAKPETNDDCKTPITADRDEYSIANHRINTSFKEGEILISYLSEALDEDGYLMMPNHPVAYTAVVAHMMAQKALQDYGTQQTQGSRIFWIDMMQNAEKQIRIARSQLEFPSTDEFEAFIKNHWNKMVPNWHSEYNLNRYKPDEYQPYKV